MLAVTISVRPSRFGPRVSAAPAKNSAGRLSRSNRANAAFEREFGFGGRVRRLAPRVRTADEQGDSERQLEDLLCGFVRVLTDGEGGGAERVRERADEQLPEHDADRERETAPATVTTAEHHERRAQRDRARPGDEAVQEDLEDDRVHGRRPGALAPTRSPWRAATAG